MIRIIVNMQLWLVGNSNYWSFWINNHISPQTEQFSISLPFDISQEMGAGGVLWIEGKTEKRAEVADVKKKKTLFAKPKYKTPAQRFEKKPDTSQLEQVTLRYRLQSYRQNDRWQAR